MDTGNEPAFTQFAALGSTIEVGVTRRERLDVVAGHVRARITEIDVTFSRFRDDSELAFVERHAGEEVRCSALFLELVRLAYWAGESTAGWFDPTVRDAIEAAGYDRDIARLEAEGPGMDRRVLPAGRWSSIRFDLDRGTLILPPGVRLDFGGIGKGFAVDYSLRTLDESDLGVLVNAGGDIAITGSPPEGGWPCDIAATLDAPAETTVWLQRGALATSGLGRRRWIRDGRTLHHLINPFTGEPGESPWSHVSAVAGNCVAAEVAAKVGWLRGVAGPAWMEGHGLAARFCDREGRVVLTAGWPAPESTEHAA